MTCPRLCSKKEAKLELGLLQTVPLRSKATGMKKRQYLLPKSSPGSNTEVGWDGEQPTHSHSAGGSVRWVSHAANTVGMSTYSYPVTL